MPFFKAKPEHENGTDMDEAPVARKRNIFSFKSSSKTSSQLPPRHQSNASFFRRRGSSSVSSTDRKGNTRRNGGFLGMGRKNHIKDDPSIRGAREKVAEAEKAEKEADRALNEARKRVRLARHHVQSLEREVVDDAKHAKAKQAEAKIVKKSAKSLGRHGN